MQDICIYTCAKPYFDMGTNGIYSNCDVSLKMFTILELDFIPDLNVAVVCHRLFSISFLAFSL